MGLVGRRLLWSAANSRDWRVLCWIDRVDWNFVFVDRSTQSGLVLSSVVCDLVLGSTVNCIRLQTVEILRSCLDLIEGASEG